MTVLAWGALFLFSVWALAELAWLACPEDRRGPWTEAFEWELWLREKNMVGSKARKFMLMAAFGVGVFMVFSLFRKRRGREG